MIDASFSKFACLYTSLLLPDADAELFERTVVEEIMPKNGPHFGVIRTTQYQNLEHHLLKDTSAQGHRRYVWQIRVLDYAMVGNPSPDVSDYNNLFDRIELEVREALAPWGAVESAAVLREIGSWPSPALSDEASETSTSDAHSFGSPE